MPTKEIEPSRLREFIRFDQARGAFFWLPRARLYFSSDRSFGTWNGRYAHKEAFSTVNRLGYRYGTLLGRYYLAHRVMWAFHHGWWPPQIDHINGDRLDNSLSNLRPADFSVNAKNHRRRSDNTTGRTGVYWKVSRSKWCAGINIEGRWAHLGYFECRDEAVAARRAAEQQNGYHQNHGRAV